MNQRTTLYENKTPEAAKSLDELLEMMPQGEPYQTAWKFWYMIRDHEKIMCSISGGWDSDIMMDLNIRCGGKEKTTFCFFDTGLEYDATKQHIKYLEERYGIEIKVLKPKKAIPTCCKEYGVPFWSKFASEMIHRLQKEETGRPRILICPPGKDCTVRETKRKAAPLATPQQHAFDFVKKRHRGVLDVQRAAELYDRKLCDGEIARELGVAVNTICGWRKRTGRTPNLERGKTRRRAEKGEDS